MGARAGVNDATTLKGKKVGLEHLVGIIEGEGNRVGVLKRGGGLGILTERHQKMKTNRKPLTGEEGGSDSKN